MSIKKPKIVQFYARFESIDQMYDKITKKLGDNYILKFINDQALPIGIFISDKKTRETEKNPKGLSRLKQLGFSSEKRKFKPGNYVFLKVKIKIEGQTEYLLDDEVKRHKKGGLEIVSIKKIPKSIFKESYSNFIAEKFESEFGSKLKEGWTYKACIKHYMKTEMNKLKKKQIK